MKRQTISIFENALLLFRELDIITQEDVRELRGLLADKMKAYKEFKEYETYHKTMSDKVDEICTQKTTIHYTGVKNE